MSGAVGVGQAPGGMGVPPIGGGMGGGMPGQQVPGAVAGPPPGPGPGKKLPPLSAQEAEELVRKAKKRFDRTLRFTGGSRDRFVDDLKFSEADAYNGYQWPNTIRKQRDVDDRPCLTINKTRQHNLQIINDGKQNKPGVAVRGVGNGATYESAQCFAGVIRHIEYQSRASTVYDLAVSFQVRAGYGVIRVATDYAGDDSFDQEIFIRPVADPLTVMFDPSSKEQDRSDSKFAFVFDEVDKDDFDDMYPEYKGAAKHTSIGPNADGWITEDKIRICEYFYTVPKTERILRFTDPATGQEHQLPSKKIPKELLAQVIDSPTTRERTVVNNEIHYVVIIGDKIAEGPKLWPGRYIPLIPVIGEETLIDGNYDCKGHTRALLDPQRMYNYWTSAAVEYGALQTKSPWIAPAAAIEGQEVYWNNANRVNTSVLPWNHIDDDGQPVPPPVQAPAPAQAPLYIEGMKLTQLEMMLVSGQYEAQMGQPSNERSGKAISERQRQGDNATYHYIDNLAVAIRQLGKVLLDLIPKIYDTPRVLHIIAEDGASLEVQLDPQAQQAFTQQLDENNKVAQRIFNPNVGKYDVEADIGPAYATKRQEAFNAFTQILTQAPDLAAVIGDILMTNGDFPGADEAAVRLKRMVPPQALGTGPNQQEQQLQMRVQQLEGALAKTFNELVGERLKVKGKDMMRDIDVYEAETARMKALGPEAIAAIAPQGLQAMIQQLVTDSIQTQIGAVVQTAMKDMLGLGGGSSPTPVGLNGIEHPDMAPGKPLAPQPPQPQVPAQGGPLQ